MLLGSTNAAQTYQSEDILIVQLLNQGRYAEAYTLLKKESLTSPATIFNLALCHYWVGNYADALLYLEKVGMMLPHHAGSTASNTDSFYKSLRDKQNQTNDHHQGITSKYASLFKEQVRDAVIRLKTDCWLKLENWTKVIEIATPIAFKNYHNIADALQIAKNKLSLS